MQGVDRVISVDLQPPGHGQIEGFFDSSVPVENVRSTRVAIDWLASMNLHRPVVVAPNEACVHLAADFRNGLDRASQKEARKTGQGWSQCRLAVILESGASRGQDRYVHAASEDVTPHAELVGDVRNRDVVIVDDMLDTAGTLERRVELLKAHGARR